MFKMMWSKSVLFSLDVFCTLFDRQFSYLASQSLSNMLLSSAYLVSSLLNVALTSDLQLI